MTRAKPEARVQAKPGTEELMEQLREFVRAQLRDGAEPCDLSYVLAYVATEMGLVIASNPVGVFPVVLEGVTKAALKRLEAEPKAQSTAAEEDVALPSKRLLH